MQFLGASQNELLFVVFMVTLVLAAPKIPKLGERVGAWLSRSPSEKHPPGRGDT